MHRTQAVVRKHSGERPNALTGPLARLRYKHRAACAAPLLSNHRIQAVVRKHSGERPQCTHRAACAAPLQTPGRLRGSACTEPRIQAVVRKHSGERPNALTGPLARLRFYWANRSSPCPAIG
jgi:hypothetical protein